MLEIHPTSVESFLLCQTRFMYAEIEKIIRPPGIALVRGGGCHVSNEANMKHKIKTGDLLSKEEVLDITRDAVASKWEERGVRLVGDEIAKGEKLVKAETVDSAIRLAGHYYDTVAPVINPLHSERRWDLSVKGFDFSLAGTIDLQETHGDIAGRIIDLKTRTATPPQAKADRSIQLTFYALASTIIDKKGIPPLRMDNVVDLKSGPKLALHETTRTQKQFDAALATVQWMTRVIKSGDFGHCPPDHWVCCQRWCGYTGICRYYGGQE